MPYVVCSGSLLTLLVSVQVLEDGTLIIAESLVVIATVKKTFRYRKRQGTGPRFSRLLLRDGKPKFIGTV